MLRECFFFSSRRRHTRCSRDWSSDVCPSDLIRVLASSTSSRWDNLGTLRGACRNTWHKCGHEALGRSASPYESRKGYSSTRYALLLKYHIFSRTAAPAVSLCGRRRRRMVGEERYVPGIIFSGRCDPGGAPA